MVETRMRHPLEHLVIDYLKEHKNIDVTDLSIALYGGTIFRGRSAGKGVSAYRIVAADVLGHMVSARRLEQHGDFGANPENGGPYFTLPAPLEAERYCTRCGAGPLVALPEKEEMDMYANSNAVCEDFEHPELCDWCGHTTAKSLND